MQNPQDGPPARNLETARKAHKAGVKFAMGSDAIYSGFGENTKELAWFVKAGMTPEEALKTTTNAAELHPGRKRRESHGAT